MDRHGGSVHYVRPDRVVRTGVLTPIVGYQPQMDVMAVTQSFTDGPSSGMQLSGLGYFGAASPNIFQRALLRIQAAFARAKANRMMLTSGVGVPSPMAAMAAQVAPQGVAPQITAMREMANFLSMRGAPPQNGSVFPQRRWNTYFYSG